MFDRFCENVYVIADSNHGYKMIGVGKLVADDICGNESDLLRPFRFSPLRRGQAASDLAQPVPLELIGDRDRNRATHGIALTTHEARGLVKPDRPKRIELLTGSAPRR